MKYRFVLYIILIAVGIWAILPPTITLETSFMKTYAFINPLRAIQGMSLDNWKFLPYGTILKWGVNSLIVCGASTLLATLLCTLAGFGFAKYDFPAKEFVFGLFLLGMMIPASLLFLPRLMIIRNLKLFDTHAAMIAPMLIYPAGVFFARQYISRLPSDLIEAARVDGASDIQIFRHIITPLSLPLIAILCLFTFVYSWNQFIWQFLVARNPDIITLIVGLGQLLRGLAAGGRYLGFSEHSAVSLEGLEAAVSVIVSVPPLLIFILGQKFFVEGLVAGGVKE